MPFVMPPVAKITFGGGEDDDDEAGDVGDGIDGGEEVDTEPLDDGEGEVAGSLLAGGS